MTKGSDVDDLLRAAFVIATKLDLEDLQNWCQSELSGYKDGAELPKYRLIDGQIKAHNPYNGIWMPVEWQSKPPEHLIKRPVSQPIGELQKIVSDSDDDGVLAISFSPELTSQLMRQLDAPSPPVSVISQAQLFGVLDAVRNSILEWTLKLEKKGIYGEEMIFTEEERKSANTTIINYGSISGVIGDVENQQIQIGDYNTIHGQLKTLGVPQEERVELESLMDDLPNSEGEEKRSIIQKGISWTVKNADKIGKLSDTIREWFENGNS